MHKSKLERQHEANAEIAKRKETIKALEREILEANTTIRFIPKDTFEGKRSMLVVRDEIKKLQSCIDDEKSIISKIKAPSDDDVNEAVSRFR
ncbi:hypothetical protein [Joostella sp. CR20]|uniref:hypothetical protein n=1 Tax=Joostella sp. CR20 TaxID=2804312 RepID=UPI00313B30CB